MSSKLLPGKEHYERSVGMHANVRDAIRETVEMNGFKTYGQLLKAVLFGAVIKPAKVKGNNVKNVHIKFYLDAETLELFELTCASAGMTASEWIRFVILGITPVRKNASPKPQLNKITFLLTDGEMASFLYAYQHDGNDKSLHQWAKTASLAYAYQVAAERREYLQQLADNHRESK
jgi:hypothetical protein